MNNTDNTLLLFTPELPCWDAETVRLAGDDPKSLANLEAAGNVARLGGGYVLTHKGIQEREIVSRENYVPSKRINTLVTDEYEASQSLELNRMVQLLDLAFMTEWGIKEFKVNETFPVIPCLEDNEYFAFEGERVKAIWPENEYIKSFMAEFPDNGYETRKLPAPNPEALSQWVERNNAPCGNFTVEFVLRHHHDFAHYKQLSTPEGDIFGFVNAGNNLIRNQKTKSMIYDWFAEETVKILRPDFQDEE